MNSAWPWACVGFVLSRRSLAIYCLIPIALRRISSLSERLNRYKRALESIRIGAIKALKKARSCYLAFFVLGGVVLLACRPKLTGQELHQLARGQMSCLVNASPCPVRATVK